MSRSGYTFGDFQLDASTRTLVRGGERGPLTGHQTDVLLELVARAGEVVGKDALIEAAWRGVAVTDNSLEQAVSALRKALGDSGAAAGLIETVPRRGYRFRGEVARSGPRASDAELAAMLEPYRAIVEGRAALETLERDEVLRAAGVFERALAGRPNSRRPTSASPTRTSCTSRRRAPTRRRRPMRSCARSITPARRAGSTRSRPMPGRPWRSCCTTPGCRCRRSPRPGVPWRSSPATGAITCGSPTSRGVKNGFARRTGPLRSVLLWSRDPGLATRAGVSYGLLGAGIDALHGRTVVLYDRNAPPPPAAQPIVGWTIRF